MDRRIERANYYYSIISGTIHPWQYHTNTTFFAPKEQLRSWNSTLRYYFVISLYYWGSLLVMLVTVSKDSIGHIWRVVMYSTGKGLTGYQVNCTVITRNVRHWIYIVHFEIWLFTLLSYISQRGTGSSGLRHI